MNCPPWNRDSGETCVEKGKLDCGKVIFVLNRAALLNRIKELREEIQFMVRENRAYDSYSTHTMIEQQLHAARMQRLEQIKNELADIRAGKFHESD